MGTPRKPEHRTANIAQVLTLRDPAGLVLRKNQSIYRVLRKETLSAFESFLSTDFFKKYETLGTFPKTSKIRSSKLGVLPLKKREIGAVFSHETIPFMSYPHEWPLEMLRDSALLTLQLCDEAMKEGFWLKDATPFNVAFRGTTPIFFDLLSFAEKDPLQFNWIPYGQFVRTFLNPLLLGSKLSWPLGSIFLNNREGLETLRLYEMLTWTERLSPKLFWRVTLPAWTQIMTEKKVKQLGNQVYKSRLASSPEKASFIVGCLISGLRRSVKQIRLSKVGRSAWLGYVNSNYSFTQKQFEEKSRYVSDVVKKVAPSKVLDVGCNTGHFSFLAAKDGASVLAIDSDPAVISDLYLGAKKQKADILPLVVSFSHPSPATGWNLAETSSFIERCEHAQIEMVFMLAVLHHIVVTDGIPIHELVGLLSRLTKKWLVIEYISPKDRAFSNLCHGRDYSHFTEEFFVTHFKTRFEITDSFSLSGSERKLYLMQLKQK